MDRIRHDAETGSQWSGSQYSTYAGDYNGGRTSRTSRLSGGGHGNNGNGSGRNNGGYIGGVGDGGGIATVSMSPRDPGWRGSSGSRYQKTSAVSRNEILDLLDSDV